MTELALEPRKTAIVVIDLQRGILAHPRRRTRPPTSGAAAQCAAQSGQAAGPLSWFMSRLHRTAGMRRTPCRTSRRFPRSSPPPSLLSSSRRPSRTRPRGDYQA